MNDNRLELIRQAHQKLIRKTASNGFMKSIMNSSLVREKSLIDNENKYFDNYQKQDDDITTEIKGQIFG